MPLVARQPLYPVGPEIYSIYFLDNGLRARLNQIVGGKEAPADVVDGLAVLDMAVSAVGGTVVASGLGRSLEVSQDARDKYEAGTGPYAAPPGYSWHNPIRALDIDLGNLGLTVEQLHSVIKGTGWTDITGENWHLQFLGKDWTHVYERLIERYGGSRGSEMAAMGACTDLGWDCYSNPEMVAVQAQCHRAGVDVGEIDGLDGPKTQAGLKALSMLPDTPYTALHQLESRPYWFAA